MTFVTECSIFIVKFWIQPNTSCHSTACTVSTLLRRDWNRAVVCAAFYGMLCIQTFSLINKITICLISQTLERFMIPTRMCALESLETPEHWTARQSYVMPSSLVQPSPRLSGGGGCRKWQFVRKPLRTNFPAFHTIFLLRGLPRWNPCTSARHLVSFISSNPWHFPCYNSAVFSCT